VTKNMAKNTHSEIIPTVDRVLQAVVAIPIDRLERVMQEAHESDAGLMDPPPEPFPISRQALRMLWHFRCNIEAVDIHPESSG